MKTSFEVPHSKPWITGEDKKNIKHVLIDGMIARGELVKRFEKRVAEYNNCVGAISFSSATFAIVFALRTLDVGKGKEVIIPTYVCRSVLDAVRFVGAKPILCDTGEDTWNITPESVKPCITNNTVAIIVVHTFGIPADVKGLIKFGVPVIEDSAQAFGSECGDRKVGSIGDMGVYSFHATKCLAAGEGGMLVCNNQDVFKRLRQYRDKMHSVISPLSDLQAVLGLSQLERYDTFLEKRRSIADFYFNNLPEKWTRRLNDLEKGNIFFRFPLYGDFDFDYLRVTMNKSGIQIRKGVDLLLHRLLELEDKKFPNAVEHFNKTVSIPIYPALTEEEIENICHELITAGC